MNDLSTIDCTDLITRSGIPITKIHGFSHGPVSKEAHYQTIRGKPLGAWWAVVDFDWGEDGTGEKREIDVGNIMYSPDSESGKNACNEVSKLCMDYLTKHGTFHKSWWIPNQ